LNQHSLQVVEVRFAAESFGELMARLRTWLEDESFRPRTLRYRLSEPESVLRVDFEAEGQAQVFAQAFDGVVLAQACLDHGATTGLVGAHDLTC
jgi:hypothetical protein